MTLYVAVGQTVQYAIEAAPTGSVVQLEEGVHLISAPLLPQGKAMTLRGAVDADGVPTSILDGQLYSVVLVCSYSEDENTRFENINFRRGLGTTTGGLINLTHSSPSFDNCIIEEGQASFGAGVYAQSVIFRFNDCIFRNNSASVHGGGIYAFSSYGHLENCVFESNDAVGYGGGLCLWNGNYIMMNNLTVRDNSAASGAGFYLDGNSDFVMNDSAITGNTASGSGGGIYCNSSETVEIENSLICGNAPTNTVGNVSISADSCLLDVCDEDNDGVNGCDDQCPDAPDTDTDGDGVADCIDQCPNDPNKTEPGSCGCGEPDIDSDGDGLLDCDDPCPNWYWGCSDDGMTYYVSAAIGGLNHVLNNLVPEGGTIQLETGTYTEWWLNPAGKSVTIRGAVDASGTPTSIIQASNIGPVFRFDSGEGNDTLLENLWLQNGSGQTVNGSKYGGLVYCVNSSPKLKNCYLSDGAADYGGAVYAANSSMLFENCKVSNSTASASGAGFYFSGDSVSLEGVQVCELGNDPIAGAYIDLGGNSFCESCSDSDGDNILDCEDQCDGETDVDSDGDGVLDCNDQCPDDPNKTEPGDCGCGVPDVDSDNDGVMDCNDQCPGEVDIDTDGDGIADCVDECPEIVGDCPTCESDLNGDEIVNIDDLLQLIGVFGTADESGDLDGNGVVAIDDMLILISAWGGCP